MNHENMTGLDAVPDKPCLNCSLCAAARRELALMPEVPEPAPPAEEPVQEASVVDVRFRAGGKIYYFDPDGLSFQAGDAVILDTARGPEFGRCAGPCHQVPIEDLTAPLRKVLRLATERDLAIAAANREKEKRAFEVCQQRIAEHKLEMQLVSAECAFDGSKILFFFTAEGRVDFRELVKNLASTFRTRIELRQIGVRDKAKMVGGLGVCGKEFCCTQFMDEFQPVSIKMAKTQNLSLNPGKISGTCGRLMCCLKYEQEAYEDLLQNAPKPESFVDTPGGRGTVCDINLLRQTVRVRMEDAPDTIEVYRNDELAVLRSGKPRKGSPPIPKDLAPVSGQNNRRHKPEREAAPPQEEERFQSMFRKLDDYAAGEPEHPHRRRRGTRSADATPPLRQEAAEHEGKPRRRRNRRPKRPNGGTGNP